LGRIVASVVLLTAQIAPFFVFAPSASASADGVTICHRTNSATNPYEKLTVNSSAVDGIGGNDHYGQHTGKLVTSKAEAKELKDNQDKWGDIIPPLEGVHTGLNWTTEGQEVLDNDCEFGDDLETTVKVIKNIVPSNDDGLFDLFVNGDLEKEDASNGDSTDKVEVKSDENVVVKEKPGLNLSNLDEYTTYIECQNQNDEVVKISDKRR